MKMSVEELRKDSEEIAKLLAEATRKRAKDALTMAKAEVDREIVNLEMKARQQAERNANNGQPPNKRYYKELTEYAWDQSDKFIKLFVTLDGVQNLDESAVTIKCTDKSMTLHIENLNGKDYGLIINNLLESIDIEKSYRKLKTGMVNIYLKKLEEGIKWSCLTAIQKRLKEKEDKDFKPDPENPQDALVNIMKKMYQSGDTQTKQMIAKAWTESQEKAMKAPAMDINLDE